MKIEKFTRNDINMMSEEFKEACIQIMEPYGIDLRVGNISFDEGSFTLKIHGKVTNLKTLAKSFARELRILGLPEDTIGRKFTVQGTEYTVQEIILRKRKYPIICSSDKSKLTAFTTETVSRLLK